MGQLLEEDQARYYLMLFAWDIGEQGFRYLREFFFDIQTLIFSFVASEDIFPLALDISFTSWGEFPIFRRVLEVVFDNNAFDQRI